MSKRAIYVCLLLVASQLASGCCCVRQCLWRWRCAPCGNGTCAPSFRPVMPPIGSHPVASAPLLHGGPDCANCGPGGVPMGGYVGPAGGVPTISGPYPLGNPTVEPSRELPFPNTMPKDKDKGGN